MNLNQARDRETPVSWPLRAWLIVEVGFGLAAISAVFLRPGHTEENFAWPIRPTVMAALLGAFYLAVGAMFVRSVFARRWEEVRVVVLPAAVFTALMLLATFLHWEKFNRDSAPFAVWFASYLLPPPTFLLLYWWQQRRAAPVGAHRLQPLPRWFRSICLYNGGAFVVVSTLIFLFPRILIDSGPWALTPLTARVLAGWLVGTGLLLVCMAWENTWARVRIGSVMLIVLPIAVLIQLLRYRDEVEWGNPWLLVDLVDFIVLAAIMAGMWLREGRRALAPRPVMEQADLPA